MFDLIFIIKVAFGFATSCLWWNQFITVTKTEIKMNKNYIDIFFRVTKNKNKNSVSMVSLTVVNVFVYGETCLKICLLFKILSNNLDFKTRTVVEEVLSLLCHQREPGEGLASPWLPC